MSSNLTSKINAVSNSSASLEVCYDGGILCVKKTESNNFDRVLRNVEKQNNYAAIEGFEVVSLNIETKQAEKIVCKMPYIKGIVGIDYVRIFSSNDFYKFKSLMRGYFATLINESSETVSSSRIINDKLDELKINIEKNDFVSDSLKMLANRNIEKCFVFDGCIRYPKSRCHGDFTLSNVIYKSDVQKIYLIDIIDIYIDTYLSDYVKLEQDLLWGWSCRFNESSFLKLKIMGDAILKELPIVETQLLNVLRYINIIRIIPYCYDEVTERWLVKTLVLMEKKYLL